MNAPIRIVVADSPEGAGRDLSVEIDNLPAPHELQRVVYAGDAAKLAAACRDAQAVLTDYAPFGHEVLRQLPDCRLISVAATGWDNVDVDAAAQHGISVCAVGEYCTNEVADHTMALLLALNRKLLRYHAQVQARHSWAWDEVTGVRRLAGQTLGIIGLGRIGRAVAARARGFGLGIVGYDPRLNREETVPGVRMVELRDLLRDADIITLHCSLGPGNVNLLDRQAFDRMQAKPLLLNVARGALVEERALVDALDAGQVTGAALDVLAHEPPDLAQHPLAGRENVILTPHVAFYSDASLRQNRVVSARNIRHYFAGEFDAVDRFVHRAEDGADHESQS